MNLNTHIAYPEIQVGADFSWTAKLIKSDGSVAQEFSNKSGSRAKAIIEAKSAIAAVADGYLIPEKGEH